jgi:two-component system phosphate regulon sensor histidine kinase PhoR
MFFGTRNKLKEIIVQLERVAFGDPELKINVYSHGQIGKLVEEINNALSVLDEKIARLNKENNQAKAILNNMVEGVIAVNKDSRVISINPMVEELFNIDKKDMEGKLFLEAIRNNDISDLIDKVLENGEFVSQELTMILPVNKTFEVNASPIFQEEKVNGCLVVLHDITEIRKLEKVRSDFIANISHELKTPLTSIKGFVETLLEGALDDKENSREFLKIIQRHTDRLNSLINDLLQLSYLESKEVNLTKEDFQLRSLLNTIISGFTTQLNKKNIKLINEIAPDIMAEADKEKIQQVFTNLIDNAIKFNKENGNIKIYARKDQNGIKVTVEDSGLGLPEKDIPRIFERFYRVDKARSRELGGTGLGLAIVRHAVELHGGAVGVESTEGLGSKFWFTLPQ